jgi:hypothetical protein
VLARYFVRAVAIELSFENLGVVAIVVAIRHFLSFTWGLEITGG